MEDDLKILKVEYLSNHWSDLLKFETYDLRTKQKLKIAFNEEDLLSYGRRPHNIKSGISQQPLVAVVASYKVAL